ncbi:hypothetical protein VNO77_39829 [Canavalia gladiata]|uniref:Uncharacterized protein n=1 Tax=Canavalia gladiata TaxID=3824 RepID=A0AAN9PRL6_CANGL
MCLQKKLLRGCWQLTKAEPNNCSLQWLQRKKTRHITHFPTTPHLTSQSQIFVLCQSKKLCKQQSHTQHLNPEKGRFFTSSMTWVRFVLE